MILTINMLLKKLIKNLPKEKKNIKIKGLAVNNKEVKKDYIFFAIRGYKNNGEKFINDAIIKGASVIVCAHTCNFKDNKVLVLRTSNVRSFLSEIASKFFRLKPKNIIAVTGTNGKTSVAELFYQILNLNRVPVASIGTLGIKYNNKVRKSNLTSPDIILMHKTLETIKKNKIDNVIIEASSHGLLQNRMDFLKPKVGIFTNFSQDHLDYHKTMNSYLNAKLILFKKILPKKKLVISDESIKEFSILKKISKKRNLHLLEISKIKEKLIQNKKLILNEFQLKNLSMAIAAAKACGLKEKKIFASLNKIKDVNGRLELVKVFPNNIKAYIDFAHTPDALHKSLIALRDFHNENIILVFGCGGDRDFKKRPLMAKIASAICKKIYVTDDNPRNENPGKIRREIIRNIQKDKVYNIGNRKKAIELALRYANPNEIILVAGKGHEEEQIYKDKVIAISDKQIIKNVKLKFKKISLKDQNFLQNKKIIKEIIKSKISGNFHGLCIDTRVLKKGNLFLTIKGNKNDGSNFVPSAFKKGAKYVVSSKSIRKYKNKILKVDNEINFLKKFAFMKRDITKAKIVAITGSAGKTSLKNLIKDLLKNFGETLFSPKSYNNHFGVPLSLSHLNTIHKFGVFEIGMSKSGEISLLSKLVKPHIGIITNIGEAHIENFNNLKGIANAKSEIIENIQNNGVLILNRDDKYYTFLAKKAESKNIKVVSFGLSKKSDIHPMKISKINGKTKLIIKIDKRKYNLEFNHINIYNVLSSLALIKELNLSIHKVIKYFKKLQPTEGRGKIHNIKRYMKKFKLIDESYNANPLSVRNAIKKFDSIKKQNFKKYLILGDMLELGKKSEPLHKELSKVINNSDIDKVFIKGNKTLVTYKNINKNKRGNIFQQDEDVDFTLNNIIANNDYLMIKGSNATGLNILTERIIKGY